MNNKDLIKQYVDTGLQISEYQVSRLNSSDKKTYIRKRIIATEMNHEFLSSYEYELIDNPEQLSKYLKKILQDYSQSIHPRTYIEDINRNPEVKSVINRLRELYRGDSTKVRDIVVSHLLDSWLIHGEHIPFQMLQNLPEPLLKKYSNMKLDSVFLDGRDDLVYDKWMLKYGDETIRKYLDRIKKDTTYFSDKVKTWVKRGEKIFLSIMEVFMTNPELNQSLDEMGLLYILIESPTSTYKQIFEWYLNNGGNMEIINQNSFLISLYNKAFGNEQ